MSIVWRWWMDDPYLGGSEDLFPVVRISHLALLLLRKMSSHIFSLSSFFKPSLFLRYPSFITF